MTGSFGFRKKLMLLGIPLTVIPILAIAILIRFEYRATQAKAVSGTTEMASNSLEQSAEAIYTLIDTNRDLIEHHLGGILEVAQAQLESSGKVSLGPAKSVAWKAINQFHGLETGVSLPQLLVGNRWVGQQSALSPPVPVVDEIRRITGAYSTLFQRMNGGGDMLRVATNVTSPNGLRAVGTYIPAVNPDGTPNAVVATVLAGKPYIGRAMVMNAWYATGYRPLFGPGGDVIGMLFAGIPEGRAADRLRRELASRRVGRTGYVYILNATGKTRGHYVVSRANQRDGENIWDAKDATGKYIIREICQRALSLGPKETAVFRYSWHNPGDAKPVAKLAYIKYYKPWDWLIGVSAPEKELTETGDAIAGMAAKTTWIMSLILLLAIVGSSLAWWAASRMLMSKMLPVVDGLLAAAAGVTRTASQVSRSSESLLDAVHQSSQCTVRATASLESVSAMTRSNHTHAERAEALAADTHTAVTEGAQAVGLLNSAMGRIHESNDEVGKILKEIDGIAFQTNLLSLNAAVEAARAGDAGLSFAVVAGEVRTLAQRAAEAARDTAEKVGRSRESGASAVTDSASVTQRLDDILAHSQQLKELVSAIASSSREQSAGIGEIEGALHQIETAAGTTSASAQESAQVSGQLSAEAQRLNQLADQLSAAMYGKSAR